MEIEIDYLNDRPDCEQNEPIEKTPTEESQPESLFRSFSRFANEKVPSTNQMSICLQIFTTKTNKRTTEIIAKEQ